MASNWRDHCIEHARVLVVELAQRGTDSQREVIASVRALAQIVGRLYAKTPADPAGCNQYLTALTGNLPWIRGLSVAGTDGRIKCATDAEAVGLNLSDRPHFQSALHTKDFALSNYLVHPPASMAQPGRRLSRHRRGRRGPRRHVSDHQSEMDRAS